MNKKLFCVLMAGILFLAACGTPATSITPTVAPVVATETPTSAPTPTLEPTNTPTPEPLYFEMDLYLAQKQDNQWGIGHTTEERCKITLDEDGSNSAIRKFLLNCQYDTENSIKFPFLVQVVHNAQQSIETVMETRVEQISVVAYDCTTLRDGGFQSISTHFNGATTIGFSLIEGRGVLHYDDAGNSEASEMVNATVPSLGNNQAYLFISSDASNVFIQIWDIMCNEQLFQKETVIISYP
ncbi:hypothetical protein KBC75_00965 [Candidatus Shapirobacteria bacterium]|nr:hypothetical protein [Candidatus Shapirobacteria bacterium]